MSCSPGRRSSPSVCRFHHAQKTREGYRLEGGPGHWRWLKPDGTDVDPRPPPRPGRALRPPDDTGTIAERQARICDAAIARVEERWGNAEPLDLHATEGCLIER